MYVVSALAEIVRFELGTLASGRRFIQVPHAGQRPAFPGSNVTISAKSKMATLVKSIAISTFKR